MMGHIWQFPTPMPPPRSWARGFSRLFPLLRPASFIAAGLFRPFSSPVPRLALGRVAFSVLLLSCTPPAPILRGMYDSSPLLCPARIETAGYIWLFSVITYRRTRLMEGVDVNSLSNIHHRHIPFFQLINVPI